MRILSLLCCLLFLTLFLTNCGPAYILSAPVKVIDSEEMTWIVEKVMTRWSHRNYQRLNLEHSYVHYSDAITFVHLEISSQEILEMCPARHLLVDLVEDLLFEINTNPIVSDQLADGIFTADNLHIEINFESFHGYYVDPFFIGCICLHDGMARYSTFDMKDEDVRDSAYIPWYSWHSRVEPYTKSREISVLSRAAEKDFRENRRRNCQPSVLDEFFIMDPCHNLNIYEGPL